MDFIEHIQDRSFGLLGFDTDEEFGGVDYDEEVVTFPLYNLSGQMLGYQTYRWNKSKASNKVDPRMQRYFTRLPREALAVYGLHLLPEGYLGPIFLVEGVWEAIVGYFFGVPCVAVLGSDPKGLMNWVHSIANPVVALVQPDSAGQKLKKYGKNGYIQLEGDLDDLFKNGGWLGVPEELSNCY